MPSIDNHSNKPQTDNTARLLFLIYHQKNLNFASQVSEIKLPLIQHGIKLLKFSESLLGKPTTGGSGQTIAEELS